MILRFTLRSGLTLIGGYYYGREEDTREEWQILIECLPVRKRARIDAAPFQSRLAA